MAIDSIVNLTTKTMNEWKDAYGWAPDSAAKKLDKAMLKWIIELTSCLEIWFTKGDLMTDGELILARVNMGSLVESWLKFFYCVFYEDYLNHPMTKKNTTILEPNDMNFEKLKIYSRGKLWEQNDHWDKWVEKIQKQRNAIHAFNFKDIGASTDYLFDIIQYYDFIKLIVERLPESPASAR